MLQKKEAIKDLSWNFLRKDWTDWEKILISIAHNESRSKHLAKRYN